MSRRAGTRLVAVLGLIGVAAGGAQAQGALGSVAGRISDAVSSTPIVGARVVIAGTQLTALTGDDGRYTIRGVTPGNVEVQVNRLGYQQQHSVVAVSAGQAATLNFALLTATYSLSAVVTTVTGAQKKVELANATTQIAVGDKIGELAVKDMGSLLSGRASNVQVVQTGATGTGARIRIRGQNSFSLSNDPIVVIDGVRATSTTNNALGVGGSGPSRLDDINPSEIENIEVVKGPSAATLYGTEAANGVIVITTKRGKSGVTKYGFNYENGKIDNTAKYPDLWSLWGKVGTSQTSSICLLAAVAAKTCAVDSLSHGNVLNTPGLTPIGTGDRQVLTAQASGGNDKVQYFVSGSTQTETGVYKMPDREVTRLLSRRGVDALPSNEMRPNALARNSLRANLSSQLSKNWFVQVSSSYTNSTLRLPQNEDNSNGIMVAAVGGTWRGDLLDAQGDSLKGYRAFNMGDVLSQTTTQDINRFINSVSTQYNPFSWLNTHASFGSDWTSRNDLYISKVGEGPNTGSPSVRLGEVTSLRNDINQQTSDLGASGTFQLLSWLNSKTSVGMQYIRGANGVTQAVGNGGLPPGGVTVSAAATKTSTQTFTDRRTLGYFVEQLFSINEKLYLTAGMRRDAANAFGKNFAAVYYPKFGASWLISDQAFFHRPDWINSLRLRGAYGASGQIPGPTSAVRFYSANSTTLASGDAPGASLGSLGNQSLKPEFSLEKEFGFDLAMFNGKTNIELTSYDKTTRDALISRLIAPSLSGLTTQFVNIGKIQNKGVELNWNQKVLDTKHLAIDFALTGSTVNNKLLILGEGISPIASGNRNTQQNREGYPLFGLWDKSYTYADANGDGILVQSEIKYSDTTVYLGSTLPTKEMAFTPSIELLDHKLKISSQFDRKWGFRKFNNTLRHQCMNGVSCRGRYDPTSPLDMQAAALSTSQAVYTGMFEDGQFTRWRELSVSYELPAYLANRVRASRWSIVATGRNLAVWTKYTGVDPEAAQSNSDARGNEEYFSTPPLRSFTLRLNFSF
jgi:TonB-linked SusC/RagA family outer membrane protein